MSFDLPRMNFAGSFGSLLDVAADSGLDKIELNTPQRFGVERHWRAVGNRMRSAMIAVEHEQAAKQKAANRKK